MIWFGLYTKTEGIITMPQESDKNVTSSDVETTHGQYPI